MRKLKCLTVDDEKASLEVLANLIRQRPDLVLTAATSDPRTVPNSVEREGIDLLFVDLHMDHLHGIDLIKMMAGKVEVICCTADNQYGSELIELDVAYYLTKPFSKEQFNKAITRVWDRKDGYMLRGDLNGLDGYIVMKGSGSQLVQMRFAELECLEAAGNYTEVTYAGGQVTVAHGLGYFEDRLPSAHFLRTHKSYIVARKNIANIEFNRRIIILRNSLRRTHIPIGKTYINALRELFGVPAVSS